MGAIQYNRYFRKYFLKGRNTGHDPDRDMSKYRRELRLKIPVENWEEDWAHGTIYNPPHRFSVYRNGSNFDFRKILAKYIGTSLFTRLGTFKGIWGYRDAGGYVANLWQTPIADIKPAFEDEEGIWVISRRGIGSYMKLSGFGFTANGTLIRFEDLDTLAYYLYKTGAHLPLPEWVTTPLKQLRTHPFQVIQEPDDFQDIQNTQDKWQTVEVLPLKAESTCGPKSGLNEA